MKNFRSSLVLALVVAGLLAYLLFFDRHHDGTARREEAALFPDFDPARADFLRLTDPDGTVELRKKDGFWAVTAPVAAEADPAAVTDVLRSLRGLHSLRSIPLADILKSGETLQGWQLVPGAVKAEFSGPDFSGVVRLGRKTAVSELLYARASNEADAPVVLLPAACRDQIDRKLADLRSRTALRFDAAKVARFGQRGAAPAGGGSAPEFELARGDAGANANAAQEWKIEKPLSAAADPGRVHSWLGRFAALKVRQFVSDDASDLTTYGLNAPMAQLWVQASGAKDPDTLLVGLPVPGAPAGSQGEVYAKRLAGNTVFTVAVADIDRLVQALPETRDRKVLPFVPDAAAALQVEAGLDGKTPRTVAAAKEGGAWSVKGGDAPVAVPADPAAVGAFLGQLGGLEAVQIVSDTTSDLKPYGLDHPSARVTVTLKKGADSVPAILLLGKVQPAAAPAPGARPDQAPEALLFAKNADLPFIYAIPASFADALPREASAWRDLRVVPADLTAAKVACVTVTPDAGTPLVIDRDAQGAWRADGAARVDALLAVRSERWLGPVQPAYGLAKPKWKIEIQGKAGAPSLALWIGAPVADGQAAQIAGQPDAFVLSNAALAAVTSPLSLQPGSVPKDAPAVAPAR